jgi:hypothetical protein
MMVESAFEQVEVLFTSQRLGFVMVAAFGTRSARAMVMTSEAVTLPLASTSPHWQASPMPSLPLPSPHHRVGLRELA